MNIAHKEADLKNWKGNLKNSGFLPEERAWMTQLTTEGGVVDVYRRLQPDTTDACYTWWSNRGQAYAKNVGWRLDYHLATPAVAEKARTEHIYKARSFQTTRRSRSVTTSASDLHHQTDCRKRPLAFVGQHPPFVSIDTVVFGMVQHLFVHHKTQQRHVFMKGGAVAAVGVDHPDF